MSIVAGFLDVKVNRMVLGEAKNLNGIVIDRYGGGGDGNNEVQTIRASTLVSVTTIDDPSGGVSGIIAIQPQGACVDADGNIYSGQRNNDSKFRFFDAATNAAGALIWNPGVDEVHCKWIPDANGVQRLLVINVASPAVVNVFNTSLASIGSASLSYNGGFSTAICTAIDSRNHLWVFNQPQYAGATSDATLDEINLSGFTTASYTLSGSAGLGAYRAMWYSAADQQLVFLTALGYLVRWDTVAHTVTSSALKSELASIGAEISADMARFMTNENTGKLWMTQNDGFTLASYDLVTLAINNTDTTNLRTAFAGIPNFPTSTWVNSSPCGFMPYTRAFVGWAEPGGSNHYTWYILATPPAPTTNVLVSLNGTTHSFGDPFTVQDTVTGNTPTGTTTFYEGTTVLGAATVVAGVAVLTLPSDLSVGTHTIHAVYNGDFQNASSTSNDLTLVVTTAQSINFGTGSHSTTKAIKAHNQKYWFNEEQQRKLRHK